MRTFSLLVLAILGFAFVACDDDDHLGDWAKAPEFSGRLRNQAVSFVIGDYAYVGTGFGVDLAEYTDFKKYNLNDGTWTDVPDNFPGKGRHGAVAFVAEKGGKTYAYVGLGYISANQIQGSDGTAEIRAKEYLKDFYRFDPTDNSWTKIEDFPGEARRDAVAFTLDNYGYVGTGRADKALLFKDFYCFDPETETWNTEELGFKGDQRYGASAFVVNGAAYVCLGAKGSGYAQDVIKCTPLGGGKVAWDNMQALTDKPGVKQDKDYEVDIESKTVALTPDGIAKAEKGFKLDNLYDPQHTALVHHINQALKANYTMTRDVEYMVATEDGTRDIRNAKIMIIDQFTGRVMPGRAYSDGLHQAIEAKEGVPIKEETETRATITYQNSLDYLINSRDDRNS